MKISVTLFKLYIKWSLVLKHVCAGGGGNVTFGVYTKFPPDSVVRAAFWVTLKDDATCVVMTVM